MRTEHSIFFRLATGLFACIFVVTFVSCGKTKENALSYYDVAAVYDRPVDVPLESFAQSVEAIPLETNDDILVEYIQKIVETNEYLILLHGNRCSVFDKSGKYLHDISSKGEGPDEHIQLWDLFMEEGNVCLFDRSGKKLSRFKPDGTPLDKTPLPKMFTTVSPIYNGLYAGYLSNLSGQEPLKFLYFDRNGEIVDSIPNPQMDFQVVMPIMFLNEGYVYSAGEEKYMKEIFNDTIYSLLPDNTIKPRLVLDMGPYKATPEKRYTLTEFREVFFDEMAWVMIVGENDRYLFFNTVMNEHKQTFYLDKQSQTIHNVTFILPEKIGIEEKFSPETLSADGKRLIGYYMDEESDENPVLLIAHLKN